MCSMSISRQFACSVLVPCLPFLLPSVASSSGGTEWGDPSTPAAFVECATRKDPRVLEARAEYERALAARSGAGTWANPALDAEALSPPSGGEGYKVSAGLLQPLAISGWRGHAVRAADYRIAAARIRLEAARWQAGAETMAGLARLRQITDESGMLDEAGKLCDMAIEKADKLAFLTDEQDTARQAFMWRRDAIRSRASQLLNEELELQEKLAASIGGRMPREWSYPVPFRTDWPEWPAPGGASPVTAGLEVEAGAAKAHLRMARRERWPDISVGPFVESEPGTAASGDAVGWGARIGLSVPLFDRNQGGISAADAERVRAESALAVGRLTAANRLKSLEGRYQRCVARLREYGLSFPQGGNPIEEVKARYTAGRISAAVVLEALASCQEAVEGIHGLERETYVTLWEGTYLSGAKEMPLP